MLIRIWYILLISLFCILAFRYYQGRIFSYATKNVCQQVEAHFYQLPEDFSLWYEDCLAIADEVNWRRSKQTVIRKIQRHLAALGVSHLELWSPSEMSQMWLGEDLDTGIRVTQIGSYWIVTEVIQNSPAMGVVNLGDEILSINGKDIRSSFEVEKQSGLYEIWRNGEKRQVEIQAKKISYPFQPRAYLLDKTKYKVENVGVLVLKSFTPVYFSDESWRDIIESSQKFDRLVLDLRGNTGGDFVVMQKILSSFLCEPTDIGYLIQPRKSEEVTAVFTENMDGSAQINSVKNSSVIELHTYENYPCYTGDVSVLVDRMTASTAEIFAEAIKLRKGTRILGETTSGAVLLAIWFPTYFGKQYSLSIPVALYKNWKDQIIEGSGIRPQIPLDYDLAAWRNGVDSWLLKASNL